jgi:hypothetical protein
MQILKDMEFNIYCEYQIALKLFLSHKILKTQSPI